MLDLHYICIDGESPKYELNDAFPLNSDLTCESESVPMLGSTMYRFYRFTVENKWELIRYQCR
jgi:hypothetical protein